MTTQMTSKSRFSSFTTRSRLVRFGAIAACAGALAMSTGCASSKAEEGAGVGALIGGALGAIVGHQSGSTGEGAAIGAAVGAGVGYAAGNEEDKRRNNNYRY